MKVDREELRKLVREALKEALGSSVKGAAPAKAAPDATPPAPGEGELKRAIDRAVKDGRNAEINVAMRSREDLDRFARAIAEASGEPSLKAAILSGAVGFRPVGAPEPAAVETARTSPAASAPRGGAYEMKTGVLSETKIVDIARSHRKIVVGADVVLTPLARDKARELKVELTRQKP
jgi:hypothetical protein